MTLKKNFNILTILIFNKIISSLLKNTFIVKQIIVQVAIIINAINVNNKCSLVKINVVYVKMINKIDIMIIFSRDVWIQ